MPATVYRVAPPDKLRVIAPKIKELDGQPTVVRPDGNITLNLIGDVQMGYLRTPGHTLPQRLGQSGRMLRQVGAQEKQAGKLNVGANDLKIAAIGLEVGAVVVTRNVRDFGRVPGLTVENWAAAS